MISTKEPINLWALVEHLPNFGDEYEIWQATLRTVYETLGKDFTGSIVGYVEPQENKDYSYEYASGHYKLSAFTPDGKLIQNLDVLGDKYVQWVGMNKLPFVGYVNKDKRSDYSLPEGTIWIIVPKTEEQLLSAVATFYKRRKKKDEVPNIVGISDYLSKPTVIGEITDITSFVPMRKRRKEGKSRPSATKKRISEYRNTAIEVTDEVLINAVKEKYKDFFIENDRIVEEGIKEAFRNEVPLTIENVLQQIEYLIEDRQLLQYMTALQHIYSPDAQRIREKADKIIEIIYETACSKVCNLSEFADEEVMSYFLNDLYKHREDMTLSKKMNNLCCSYHCRKYNLISCIESNNFPPFKCFDYRYGKDVTFAPSFEKAKAYNDEARKSTNTDANNDDSQIPSCKSKKGCLLWLIIIPSTLLGFLCSIF